MYRVMDHKYSASRPVSPGERYRPQGERRDRGDWYRVVERYEMGLKDLKKRNTSSDAQTEAERKALEFIGGAALISASTGQADVSTKQVYKRTTFSLTDELNRQIDMLSLSSRTFRVSRSDVIRAGILALNSMPEAELLELLARVVNAGPSE